MDTDLCAERHIITRDTAAAAAAARARARARDNLAAVPIRAPPARPALIKIRD